MKHVLAISLLLLVASVPCLAQKQDSFKVYNPKANAQLEINNAVARAAKEHKHVFLQIGGNWCKWCKYFNTLVTTNDSLNKLLNDNYVVLHVNYSPENKNEKGIGQTGLPAAFWFSCICDT